MKLKTHHLVTILGWLLFCHVPCLQAQEMAFTASWPGISNYAKPEKVALTEVLEELSKRHRVFFTYEKKYLQDRFLTKNNGLDRSNLESAMAQLFRNSDLSYRKIGERNYVIFKRKKAPEPFTKKVVMRSKKPERRTPPKLYPLHRRPAPYLVPMQFTVSGQVTSEDGEPLIGATVQLKGDPTRGTVTDIDGRYELTIPDGNGVLLVSYTGYETTEIPVENQETIDITLRTQASVLDEVVVVGYGSQLKRDVIGSVSTIKSKDLQSFNASSVDQQLQGLASGVQVSATSGVPGAPVRVLVRGTNSLFSGTEPLWIIDGMILSNQGGGELGGFSRNAGTAPFNPLATLNPNDIESVEILKDAAATAIYGSRGANGVVIVTTKTGKTGRGGLNLDVNYGINNVVRGPEEIGFVDGPTWLSLADQARANNGLPPFEPNDILDDSRDPTATLSRDQIANTNWFDRALNNNAQFYEVNLSASRANQRLSYYLSGNYRNEESILTADHMEKVTLRANLDFDPLDNLTISSKINLSYTDRERAPNGGAPGGNANLANGGYNMANTGALPILPVYHPTLTDNEGNPILFDPLSGRNLAATLDRNNYINDVETYRGLGGLHFEYRLPFIKGLALRSELSYDFIQTNNIEWANTVIREDSKYGFDFSSTFQRLNYNLYARFNRDFGNVHNINIVAGAESTAQNNRVRNLEAQEIFGSAQELGAPGDVLRVSAGLGGERYFRGYFGRLNYSLMDRYLLGLSYRRDGSSVFTEEFRWGDFLAASAGWIVTDEPWVGNIGPVNFLKIKGSFGQTGNSAISPVATETTYAGWGRYGDVGAGDLLSTIGNEAVTWETTDSWDAAVEFELWEGRLGGSVGYYLQNVQDMLFQVPIPSSSGIFNSSPRIWQNIGDMQNNGWEIDLNSVNIRTGSFTWRSNFNFTTNRNEVQRLVGENDEIYNVRSSPLVTRVGDPIAFFRLARFAGIHPEGGYELIEEMDLEHFEATGETRPTGRLIPATRANLQRHLFDMTDKTGLPTFFGGFNNTFTYKGFELGILFSFSGGNYIYDRAERAAVSVTGARQFRQDMVGNTWTTDNPDAEYPALNWLNRYDVINEDGTISEGERFDNRRAGQVHDRFLQKGDFIRLRNLSLSYNLPAAFVQRLSLRNVRLTLAANNLLTITGYEGYDPEVVNIGGDRNLQQGWVGVQLPQVERYNFRLNVSF